MAVDAVTNQMFLARGTATLVSIRHYCFKQDSISKIYPWSELYSVKLQ